MQLISQKNPLDELSEKEMAMVVPISDEEIDAAVSHETRNSRSEVRILSAVESHMADNDRDRFAYGFDAGVIVDGIVRVNEAGKIELLDDDGEVFCPEEALKTLVGKKVRLTVVSFEALANMAKMYEAAQSALGKPD